MRSIFRPLTYALLALGLLPSLPVLAAPDSSSTDVQLVQQAALVVPRDRITATLNVIMRGPDARQIQVEINRRMVGALSKVKSAPEVIAETGSYAVDHPYTTQGQSSGWQGQQTLTLTSSDIDAVLNLAGALQNDGLVMGEMRFFVSPESLKSVQDELTAAALKAMQDRAGTIADDMHLKISRYKTITVGNAQEQVGETPTDTKGAVAGQRSKAPPPAAIAGEALVTLTVNATAQMSP